MDSNFPDVERRNKIEKMGIRTASFSEVFLDNVYVSKQAVLGRAGADTTMFTHSMDCERTVLFAYHMGVMERLLETSVEFARRDISSANRSPSSLRSRFMRRI